MENIAMKNIKAAFANGDGRRPPLQGRFLVWIALAILWAGIAGRTNAQVAPAQTPPAMPPGVEKFVVATKSPMNPNIPFYLRAPGNLAFDGKPHRVLILAPYFNEEGLKCLARSGPWLKLADERGWFILSLTLKQDKKDVQDRTLSYYYPETFSGKALLDALDLIKANYPVVATDGLLLQGLSGGAQFLHRFAIWAPDRVAAVAINSCSWFDGPNEQSQQMGWLVTIGDSDPSYENSLDFLAKLRTAGALPIFRSYPGMVHEGDDRVTALDIEFLKFYDDLTKAKLSTRRSLIPPRLEPPLAAAKMPLIGDTQDWRFYKNAPENMDVVSEESRVYLPSEAFAKLWGQADNGD
jgi:pimeloyl-ACP methyl ester carboxylesterase